MFNRTNNIIKKYPVFYQNEEYEIRMEKEKEYNHLGTLNYKEYINIYKVTIIVSPNKNRRNKIKYNKVYSIRTYSIECNFKLIKDENYYINLFKYAFKEYLNEHNKNIANKNLENKQLAALENWNGVIQ